MIIDSNNVSYIQDTFCFCFSKWRCVSQRGRSLWKDYIRDKSIFIHTKDEDLLLNFYRFLSLEKIGTSHGFILNPLLFAEQGGISMRCMGGDLGKGRRNVVSRTNLTISHWLKQTKQKKNNWCKKNAKTTVKGNSRGTRPDAGELRRTHLSSRSCVQCCFNDGAVT